MKLRIQGNSLRLRLTRTEVAQLRDGGRVDTYIQFAPRRVLAYSLEGSPDADSLSVNFDGQAIVVKVPAGLIRQWAEGGSVSMESPPDADVQLLIEKDFQCLHKPEQQEPDAYPHPLAS